MEHEVFLHLFDKLRNQRELELGVYVIKYEFEPALGLMGSEPDIELLNYYRGDFIIGTDKMWKWYEPGSIMPSHSDTFDEGIKNFESMRDYLEYLFKEELERIKQQEQEHLKREKERREKEFILDKKLNNFLGG